MKRPFGIRVFKAPPGGQRKKGLKGWTGGTQKWEPKPGHRYQTPAEARKYGPTGYPTVERKFNHSVNSHMRDIGKIK